MIADRESFCQQLRQAREASGTTLEAIAEASKIQTSLLAGLERGDLSRWPSGIYRRAFVREYAAAIKVPHPDEVVGDFVRLFPDDVAVPTSSCATSRHDGPGSNRLTLALDSHWLIVPTRTGTLAAIVDLILVLSMAGLVFLLAGSYWTVTAVVALVYYSLATACSTDLRIVLTDVTTLPPLALPFRSYRQNQRPSIDRALSFVDWNSPTKDHLFSASSTILANRSTSTRKRRLARAGEPRRTDRARLSSPSCSTNVPAVCTASTS